MKINTQQFIQALRSQGFAASPNARLATPRTSNETSLVGDKELPVQGRTITPIQGIRGGYNVSIDGNSVGQLLRGGPNGRFVGNGAAIPGVLRSPQGSPQMTPNQPMNGPTMQLGGGGGMPPPRQYAPNPFQQQMMQAAAIRNRPIK